MTKCNILSSWSLKGQSTTRLTANDSVTLGLVGPVKLLMFGLVRGGGRGGVSAGVL